MTHRQKRSAYLAAICPWPTEYTTLAQRWPAALYNATYYAHNLKDL